VSERIEARLRLLEAELRELAAGVTSWSDAVQRGLARLEQLRAEVARLSAPGR
jgi:hypothetical protein